MVNREEGEVPALVAPVGRSSVWPPADRNNRHLPRRSVEHLLPASEKKEICNAATMRLKTKNTHRKKRRLPAELGTPQHCRDKVSMFSGHRIVGYYIIRYYCILVVTTPFTQRDLNIFRILSCL